MDVADRLLSLRRDYKKTSVSLAKANSHLNFVSSCQTTKKTPKGLRVGIRCSAFLADQTNVQQQFSETTTKAEHGYVHHLNTHYENVIVQLSQKKALLQDTMSTVQAQATPEEKENHLAMLEKTDTNINKLSNDLGKRKQKKLSTISMPNQKRRRTEQPTPEQRRNTRSRVDSEERGPQRQTSMVSHMTPQPPTTQPPPALQPLLHLTVADLLAGLQSPQPPQIVHANCTSGNVQPPPLTHPGVGSLGRPPQLPQAAQQGYGLMYNTPLTEAQPPQLSNRISRNFARRGRLFPQHPH